VFPQLEGIGVRRPRRLGGFCSPSLGLCLTSPQAGGSTAQVSCFHDCLEEGKAKVIDGFQDGMYGNFAERDASRGMAKQSFDLGTHLSL